VSTYIIYVYAGLRALYRPTIELCKAEAAYALNRYSAIFKLCIMLQVYFTRG
jgi:hypothetical protein